MGHSKIEHCNKMDGKLRLLLLMTLVGCMSLGSSSSEATYETVRTSNAAILNRLGLIPLQIPDGHYKKRVSGPEPVGLQSRIHQPYSRHHGQHRDSHVYVVKLPASSPYYTVTKPHKSQDKGGSKGGPEGPVVVHESAPVGFHSNGKPAKIYHWNLPLVKKIAEKKRVHAQLKMEEMRKRLADSSVSKRQQKIPGKSASPYFTSNSLLNEEKPGVNLRHRNNDKLLNYPEHAAEESRRINSIAHQGLKLLNGTHKTYRLDSSLYRVAPNNNRVGGWSNDLDNTRNTGVHKPKKHRKKAAMSYYAPIINKTGSTSIHKNFPGNGKPKAFYVMEKSRQPAYYHPLLP